MSRMERPKAMSLTDAAASRVKEIMAQRETPAVGLRVGVKARGCSGLSYFVEYAEAKKPFEEVVEEKGVTLLLDPASTMFLLGTQMDYQEDKFQSGFVFTNPNEKGRCGCGESFTV
jgi:iron-sulfur cluster assembly protein